MSFYTLITKYKKINNPIYNCIKNKKPSNKFNQGGARPVH